MGISCSLHLPISAAYVEADAIKETRASGPRLLTVHLHK